MPQAREPSTQAATTTQALASPLATILQIRDGLPGSHLRQAVQRFGHRQLFAQALNTSSARLHRYYQRKALDRRDSEKLMDTLRTLEQASTLWGCDEDALQWLTTPIPALAGEPPAAWFDTFKGREWVRQVLNTIESGEFH